MRKAEDLDEMIGTARNIMKDELQLRFFTERPSNIRLVQCYMSKQLPMVEWAPPSWVPLAKALYVRMLRSAVTIAGIGMRLSPRKKQKPAASSSTGGLFRHRTVVQEEAGDIETVQDFDAVTDEISRWETLDKSLISEFTDSAGLVNEFALLYKLRTSFPLHFTIFKQVSSHLCHEANTEQLFSQAGKLSDDNGKMDPYRLSVWVSIAANSKIFKPSTQAILERYMAKFSKGGTQDLDDFGLETEDRAEDA